MSGPTFYHTETEKQTKGSTIRYQGDFKKDLEKMLHLIDSTIHGEFPPSYVIDDSVVGNNNIKIWIRSDELGIERIINCVFRYHHKDENFGNVHGEIILLEHSQTPKSRFIGKYHLKDTKKNSLEIAEYIRDCAVSR